MNVKGDVGCSCLVLNTSWSDGFHCDTVQKISYECIVFILITSVTFSTHTEDLE